MTFHPRIDYRELHRSKRQMPIDDGKPFQYTPENRERIEAIARRYPENPAGRRSAILPALYLVQRQLGYVSLSAIQHVAGVIGCTPAEVEDVVSFYTMFYTRPVGKFVVQVCRTLPCALRGAERVTEELMAALGLEPNGTDASGTFTLMEVECLGACDRAPLVVVNDTWHECLAPEGAKKLVDDLRARGEEALTAVIRRRIGNSGTGRTRK
jgi:NADH-quinone oxidoreductase E subunit